MQQANMRGVRYTLFLRIPKNHTAKHLSAKKPFPSGVQGMFTLIMLPVKGVLKNMAKKCETRLEKQIREYGLTALQTRIAIILLRVNGRESCMEYLRKIGCLKQERG